MGINGLTDWLPKSEWTRTRTLPVRPIGDKISSVTRGCKQSGVRMSVPKSICLVRTFDWHARGNTGNSDRTTTKWSIHIHFGKSTILSEQFPLCGFRKMILYVVANWQIANVSDRLVFGTMFGSTTHWHNVEDQPSQSMIALITRILDLRSPWLSSSQESWDDM